VCVFLFFLFFFSYQFVFLVEVSCSAAVVPLALRNWVVRDCVSLRRYRGGGGGGARHAGATRRAKGENATVLVNEDGSSL